MAIYGLVIEASQSESGGNTDRPIPNDSRSLSSTSPCEERITISSYGSLTLTLTLTLTSKRVNFP